MAVWVVVILITLCKISGSEQVLVTPDGPYTQGCKEPSMSDHSTSQPELFQETRCKVITCRVCGLEKPQAAKGNGNICEGCFGEYTSEWNAKSADRKKEWKASIPGQAERTAELERRRQKAALLMEVVQRLGEAALSSQIREECYRVGYGPVHPGKICAVRNKLWPSREKTRTGKPRTPHNSVAHDKTPSAIVVPGTEAIRAKCPECESVDTRVRNVCRLKDGRIRRKSTCQACQHKFFTVADGGLQTCNPKRLAHIAATEKSCTICKLVLPVSHFGKKANDADLYRSRCRECERQLRHTSGLKSTLDFYGVNQDWYDRTLELQGGMCAICKSTDCGRGRIKGKIRKVFSIDHDHKTGKVRGLLCNKCNLGIGNFNDDIERLEAAILYLRRADTGEEVTNG